MAISSVDVALVYAPVAFLLPSLALGILKAELIEEKITCTTVYSSLRFISRLGVRRYHETVGLMRRLNMGWEILFAKAAGFSSKVSVEELFQAAEAEVSAELVNQGKSGADDGIKRLRESWQYLQDTVDEFIDKEADYILSMNPKMVGFAILTQQRNATFAIIRKIKEKSPNTITMIGGSSCSGETGLQYLRKVPAIDYAFSGEADGVFAEVCKTLMTGDAEKLRKNFPEVLTRDSAPYVRMAENMEDCRYPEYDDYFEQVKETYATLFVGENEEDARGLVLEGSRGCWYGEYQRCRFCGLHFEKKLIHYRDKSAERFFAEVETLAKKYNCRNIFMSDCALSKRFIAALTDEPNEFRQSLDLIAECRSTMKREDIRKLRLNGFSGLQPGVESLSDECLKLMNKGATVADHLAFLKSARMYGVHAIWNILHTLPGEKAEWYEEMLSLLKHLHHFEPPVNIIKLLLARDSVFSQKAEEFGIAPLIAGLSDMAMNPDDDEFLRKTAYYYQSRKLIQNADIVYRLHIEVDKWRKDFLSGVHLVRVEFPGFTVVKDARDLNDVKTYRFTGVKKDILRIADDIISEINLKKELDEKYETAEIDAALTELRELFILYRKNGRLLSLATPKNCAKYRKIKKMVTL